MSRTPAQLLTLLKGGRLVVAVVVGLGVLIASGRAFTSAYVEILWQAQAGFSSVFWKRMLWGWGVRVGAMVLVALVLLVNLRIAATTLGGIQIRRRFGNIEIAEQIPRKLVWWGMILVSLLLGLWFGAAVPPNLGIQGLLLLNADGWGLAEPVLGHDVSFYVFWLPVLRSAVGLGLMVTFLVFTLVTATYSATGAVRWNQGRLDTQRLSRVHLGTLIGVFLALIAVQLWLRRYTLLLDGSSAVQGIFGYTDAQARMPALGTLTIITLAAGFGVVWSAWKNRLTPLVISLGSVVLGGMVIGQFYPALIQRIRVEPNELASETPYIEHNLAFTRLGFGLEQLDRRGFQNRPDAPVDWGRAARQFSGLPVWNQGPLLATYRELEALFPYYDFASAAIDRYPTPEGERTVAVSVRQIERGGIQDPNWQNLHIRKRYVVGEGAVASLASIRTPEGRPQMLMTGIPPQVAAGAESFSALALERPEVFYGTRPQPYAVVNPDTEEYLAPDGGRGEPGVDFPRGILLTSGFRTALLAWQFGDANLLFASELTETSRFIYRRLAVERALAIAPFLRFPEEPFPVLANGRVVWMLEGFTGTASFPLSSADDFGVIRTGVRYLRNSVKATVDAVTGEVTFYRVPVDDPLADAYEASFPDLFRPISEMPETLRGHLRYPRSLLSLQSRVLLQYHQETAPAFHGQQDVWNEPQELAEGTNPVPYRPEYGLYALPGESEPRFHLTTVFVPAGRQNLTGMLIGRTDSSGLPELVLLDVPVADQVPGPRQIEALVEQDPIISQQFSLWRTGGSEVWTGHLHLVPAGNRMVYMEPVFLAAEADAIPELRRFVVSDGRRVTMTETLEEAAEQLGGMGPAPTTDVRPDAAPPPSGDEVTPVDAAGAAWSAQALDLLEEAESRAREGDWQGYGESLDELRRLLQGLGGAPRP